MEKGFELSDPNSCFRRAQLKEIIFVLLARDIAAPVAIRAWVEERIRVGKNKRDDQEILSALQCASDMEYQRSSGQL